MEENISCRKSRWRRPRLLLSLQTEEASSVVIEKALASSMEKVRASDADEVTVGCLTVSGIREATRNGFQWWTYADPSWARIAALVPEVVSCAEAGDKIANEILVNAVQELALCVKAVVQRLCLCGEDGNSSFPVVMVGGVLEANKSWDIGTEVIKYIQASYPAVHPIKPQVEPAVGAALLAWNYLMKESEAECHR
ncbi:hypothetical protein EZV62_027420 [Acer yangbiense]|uniref:N-acetyl-D-glucosamine kinase n=1 Tax=Acer yangbiense TaxID=1000413 RepID=A0A5C7GVI1_9ROSI|nr:hypothetical protein EZV62_027420 [Acer yangbiense]